MSDWRHIARRVFAPQLAHCSLGCNSSPDPSRACPDRILRTQSAQLYRTWLRAWTDRRAKPAVVHRTRTFCTLISTVAKSDRLQFEPDAES